ncbi:MAG: phosphoribosylamine--glycine ligase [Candidatus Wallbacteria bacterium]|nr:phosphoribosylamine--glycine ligase [Candidatus Wallbacteria bacterium]
MKVLIIGSGAREHALAWKISQSRKVDQIFILPGNGGAEDIGINIPADPMDFEQVYQIIQERKITLTVVGPELPLSEGIVDYLMERGVKVFGPVKDAARLEASKVFSKELMRKYQVPTAEFAVFSDYKEACTYLEGRKFPLVVKADGLAAGKGVVICENIESGRDALREMIVAGKFGEAGKSVVIEEYIQGEEVSLLALTDSYTILPLVPARDYKRALEGNLGKNTGGMGAIADMNLLTPDMQEKIISTILQPVIQGLKAQGIIYQGILYAGIIFKDGEPFVLEFNCRFGDPETQVILPLLENDLADLFLATIHSNLEKMKLTWKNKVSLGVVMSSRGYPEQYDKGQEIKLGQIPDDVFLFHAGTERKDGKLLVNGGRVLNLVTTAKNVNFCREVLYEAIKSVEFEKMYYRKDIGL